MREVNEDCFAYDKDKKVCKALDCLYCKKEECKFYKKKVKKNQKS